MSLQQTGLEIRDARPEEIDLAGEVVRAAYEQFRPDYPGEWERWIAMIGDLSSHARDGGEVIVAELAGQVIGSVTFYADGAKSGQGQWPQGWAGIVRLGVLPSSRGSGLGHALIEECLRRGREHGVTTIALHTTEWMAVARAMYERMGFVRDEAFDFHPRSGVVGMGYKYQL